MLVCPFEGEALVPEAEVTGARGSGGGVGVGGSRAAEETEDVEAVGW